MLKAGFYSIDITPDKLYPLAGFDLRSEVAEGVHDRIYARAAVLDNGDAVCALCSLELLGAPADMVSDIRARVADRLGLSDIYVQIGATHTHAAPKSVFRSAACYDEDYRDLVVSSATDAIVNAYERRGEVVAYHAQTEVDGVASYRDRDRADSAYSMPCNALWLKSESGERRDIMIAFFACHPTVLNESNRMISNDLVWGCESQIKGKLHATDILQPSLSLSRRSSKMPD